MIAGPAKLALGFSSVGHTYTHLFTAFYFTVVLALDRAWPLSYAELIALWTPAAIIVGAGALPAGWPHSPDSFCLTRIGLLSHLSSRRAVGRWGRAARPRAPRIRACAAAAELRRFGSVFVVGGEGRRSGILADREPPVSMATSGSVTLRWRYSSSSTGNWLHRPPGIISCPASPATA